MRTVISMMGWMAGCGGLVDGAAVATPSDAPHSPALRKIMKDEINASYSALAFLVFHADPSDDPGIAAHAATVQRGVAKLRALGDLPTRSEAGRAVFFTCLDSLALDADRFAGARRAQDRAALEVLLGRISRTCNSCHHFFRLDVGDTTGS